MQWASLNVNLHDVFALQSFWVCMSDGTIRGLECEGKAFMYCIYFSKCVAPLKWLTLPCFSSIFINSALKSSLVKHVELWYFNERRPYLPQNIPDLSKSSQQKTTLIPWALIGKLRQVYTGKGTQKTFAEHLLKGNMQRIFPLKGKCWELHGTLSSVHCRSLQQRAVGVDTEARAGVWV